MEQKYYCGEKLLNMRDLDGEKPTIFMVSGNRTSGKTTFFSHLLVENFFRKGEKPLLLYRFKQDIENVADKFFSDLQGLWYQSYRMEEKVYNKGAYLELSMFDEIMETRETFGYAVALNAADSVKKVSHVLNDCSCIFFDEFQSEVGNYAPKELEKFQSIYLSVARGHGKQFREIPVYMCSNNVSILNPYFTHFGVTERLRSDTKFLRGNGWVLEIANNESAKQAQVQSGFYKAFGATNYMNYSANGFYLNDNNTFIEKITNNGDYLVTLKIEGEYYGVYVFEDMGILYCSNKADKDFPVKISATLDDHTPNYVMLTRHKVMIQNMRDMFEKGCFRFKNLKCKQAILKTLAYY